jgi:trimethylamine---corrinoid protein Co-methyltransferase
VEMEGFTRRFRALDILGEEQLEEIHRAVLCVMETTGLVFRSERALGVLERGGCRVDHASGRVRFPTAVVEEAIRSAPSSFTVRSREPSRSVLLGGNRLYYSDMPGRGILEPETGRIRTATAQENRDALVVLDALPNFHILCAYTPYFDVEGWSPLMSITESTAAKIRLSTKVQWTGYQQGCELFAIEMARATDQDIIGISCTASPLTYPEDACESALRFAEADLPVHVVSGCMMGASAPVTTAGALVSFAAEALGGVVLVQLARRGARVSVEDSVLPMSMSTGGPHFGSLSAMLHTAACAQLWRRYGLPLFADSGWTNSKRIDYQDAWERSLITMVIALSGCHVANLHGGVFGELAFHPLQAVMDDDVAGLIGRFIEGVRVDRETVALDLITSVGPIPGNFLSTDHTLAHYRDELFSPRAADLSLYQEWEIRGGADALEHARARMDEILRTHAPLPLPPEQDREIERILQKARAHYAAAG